MNRYVHKGEWDAKLKRWTWVDCHEGDTPTHKIIKIHPGTKDEEYDMALDAMFKICPVCPITNNKENSVNECISMLYKSKTLTKDELIKLMENVRFKHVKLTLDEIKELFKEED